MLKKIIWPVLSVLVAAGIFISSSLSGEVSGYASMRIAYWVRYVIPLSNEAFGVLNFLVRKGAHFFVYFVLAFCVAHSLKFYLHNSKKLLFTAWAIAAIYGVTDEVHQYFVPGRAMAFTDMLINAAGAFAGAALVVLFLRMVARKQTKESG